MSSLPFPTRPARLDHEFKTDLRPFLGTVLLRRGRVTQERLDAALDEVERTGRRLGDVLLERRWLYESELAQALAEQNGLEYVDIAARSVDREVARKLPRDLAEQNGLEYVDIAARSVDREVARKLPRDLAEHFRCVPVRMMSSGRVLVAAADPADVDVEVLRILLRADVELAVGELSAIRDAWRHCQ
jgi:hypothetical protein